MSANNTISEAAETTAEAPNSPVDAPESDTDTEGTLTHDTGDQDDDSDNTGGSKEAARYRRRLRDAEAERDTLATRLETLQRAEAERVASKILGKAAALWAGGTAVADLLDEDGDLDPQKVTERAEVIREEFGIAAPRKGNTVPREGGNPRAHGGTGMIDVVMGRHS